MKYLCLSFIYLFILVQPALADDKSDVEKLLQTRINTVVSLLQKNDMDKQERNDKIIEIVTPLFNFEQMAKLSLGKKYWTGITKEQKKEYTSLFVKRLQESYLEKLDLYSNEDIVYDEPERVKKKMYLLTHLVSKDNKIDMLYKLYKSKEGWKVYDLEIQGVSIVMTYRSQFDGIMKKGTIDDLLAKLQTSDSFTLPDGKK